MHTLFLTEPAALEKTAAGKRLSNDPLQWPNEILAALYAANSYLGSYRVDLQIKSQDNEQRYLYGYFVVSPPETPPDVSPSGFSDRPTPAVIENEAKEDPSAPAIRIPVMVEAQSLYPMDVMITSEGAYVPLNERRTSEALIPAASMGTQQVTGLGLAYPMMNEFQPPVRSGGIYSGTGITKVGGLTATVSANQPILRRKLAAAIEKCEYALDNNPAFFAVVRAISESPTRSHTKVASLVSHLPADAVHLKKTASGAILTSARAYGYAPESREIARRDLSVFPASVVESLQKTGSALFVRNPVDDPTNQVDYHHAKTAGRYSVVTSGGNPSSAYIVPDVIALNGTRMGLSWYIGEDGCGYQEKVAGSLLDHQPDSNIAFSEPRGVGVLADVGADGVIRQVTLPVDVRNFIQDDSGPVMLCADGMRVKVSHDLKSVFSTKDTTYVPTGWAFIPCNPKVGALMEDPEMTKTASFRARSSGQVRVSGSYDDYSFSGEYGVSDLPSANRSHLGCANAEVLLGSLGLPVDKVAYALRCVDKRGESSVFPSREIVGLEKIASESKKAVTEAYSDLMRSGIRFDVPSMEDLVKVAAALSNPKSIDAVLSVGFVTPDTVTKFLQHQDLLEESVRACSEMVVASRMGQEDIPESAAVRAMAGIEDLLKGLGMLRFRFEEFQRQEVAA